MTRPFFKSSSRSLARSSGRSSIGIRGSLPDLASSTSSRNSLRVPTKDPIDVIDRNGIGGMASVISPPTSPMMTHVPPLLWLSGQHRLNSLHEITLRDLEFEPYVQFISDEADASARNYLAETGFKPKTTLRTTSMEAVHGMVATGAAVTILARLVYRPWSLDGARVELRPLGNSVPTLDLGIAWKRERRLPTRR
jgi:DNA-binding transcriptional LysR family regulator